MSGIAACSLTGSGGNRSSGGGSSPGDIRNKKTHLSGGFCIDPTAIASAVGVISLAADKGDSMPAKIMSKNIGGVKTGR